MLYTTPSWSPLRVMRVMTDEGLALSTLLGAGVSGRRTHAAPLRAKVVIWLITGAYDVTNADKTEGKNKCGLWDSNPRPLRDCDVTSHPKVAVLNTAE